MSTYAVRLTVSTYGSPVSNTRHVEAESGAAALCVALNSFGMRLADVDSIWATKVA